MKRAVTLLALVAALVLALASAASAAWQVSSAANSKGRSAATSMPQGPTPTVSVSGANVTVTWSLVSTPAPATGYTVERYDASTDAPQTIGAGCTGVGATNTCTEHSVSDGTWKYTVTPNLHAWAGAKSAKSAAVTVDTTAPTPTSLALVNGDGGTVGLLDPGLDEVSITYSEPVAVSSICSAWSNNGSNQTLTGPDVTVTVADGGGSNLLTVSTTQCALHLGTIALGNQYLDGTGDATFSGSSVSWDATAHTLTIHLGALATGTLATTPVSAGSATYTPVVAITDVAGNPIDITPVSASSQRF